MAGEATVGEVLQEWARERGLVLDDDAWARLERLIELWQRYGAAFNLVGDTRRDVLIEHVREGLAARRAAERALASRGEVDGRWLDVGSGAGLPGLVIAATTHWPVLLVEPRARRAAFLGLASATVARGQTAVVRARWGDPTWAKSGEIRRFTADKASILITSARAVFSPPRWLEIGRSIAGPRGIVLLHVGQAGSQEGFGPILAAESTGTHATLAVGALVDPEIDQKRGPADPPKKNEET